MTIRQKKDFLINLTYGIVFTALIFLVVKFSFANLMPFILGFIIATIVKPFQNYLKRAFGDRKWLSIGVMIIFYFLIGLLIFWASLKLIAYIQYLIPQIEIMYKSTFLPMLDTLGTSVEKWLLDLDPTLANVLENAWSDVYTSLMSIVSNLSKQVISWGTSIVTSIPRLFVSIIIMIVSSFFFTLDYTRIVSFFLNSLPPRGKELVLDVKNLFGILIGKYLKSYAVLMTLTFVELSIGFWILGIPNPFFLGFIISIIDILPVLGTGTVLIPWAAYLLVTGNAFLGIGLLLLYGFISVVRNILEPRVIGKEIGLHPLVTLVSMFVGVNLFGMWGLFGLPISITILVTLHREGKFNILRFFGFGKVTDNESH